MSGEWHRESFVTADYAGGNIIDDIRHVGAKKGEGERGMRDGRAVNGQWRKKSNLCGGPRYHNDRCVPRHAIPPMPLTLGALRVSLSHSLARSGRGDLDYARLLLGWST